MSLNPAPSLPSSDIWSEWLLRQRHGGDVEYEKIIRARVDRTRDRVLDGAQLGVGMTLVDVGAGDGLIAFGALDRIGASLRVILTDVSAPLLAHAGKIAADRGWHDQCTFLHGSAESLDGIASASVDVVATRASLAYVTDKAAAFRDFYRVLKPGGRISLAEPILRDNALEVAAIGTSVSLG